MHNHNDKENSIMMWIMMICCIAPVFFIILFGTRGKTFGISTWIVFGIIAIFIITHFFIMKKSHQNTNNLQKIKEDNEDKKQDSHSDHNCCH